ncbi:hypothetical protein [Parabacteroides leei]|uniref:hypothetical protein n=1 Tax=Parabacteroides leei TaxID=2939491 RepID=UPI001899ED63|nr:hypothetical protein [Parabacteroides goldsteinii]
MKVNFNKVLKDYKGDEVYKNVEVIKDGKKEVEKQPQLIKDFVCQSLYTCGEGLTQEEKYLSYTLTLRIIPSVEDIEISSEEGTLIKKVCDKYLTAGAYGQVVELIEGGK